MKKRVISYILIVFLSFINTNSIVKAEENTASQETCLNEAVIRLKYDMQKIWIEHAWWTRSFIVSNLAGLEDQNKTLERLLQNQVDIGNIIKPYYGDEAGSKLTELLKRTYLNCR